MCFNRGCIRNFYDFDIGMCQLMPHGLCPNAFWGKQNKLADTTELSLGMNCKQAVNVLGKLLIAR